MLAKGDILQTIPATKIIQSLLTIFIGTKTLVSVDLAIENKISWFEKHGTNSSGEIDRYACECRFLFRRRQGACAGLRHVQPRKHIVKIVYLLSLQTDCCCRYTVSTNWGSSDLFLLETCGPDCDL